MAKAKLDIKTEATRPLYAGVGVTDLAVEAVRDYVADVHKKLAEVQKTVSGIDFRRATIEARVADLQSNLDQNVAAVNDAYVDLAKRGESLVGRIRRQQSTKATVSSAKTTSAKAKTTATQSANATKATTTTARKTAKASAKKVSSTAKKQSTAPRSSVKATTTAAKKTATNATKATSAAASKVGD